MSKNSEPEATSASADPNIVNTSRSPPSIAAAIDCSSPDAPTPATSRLVHVSAPWCPVCRRQTALLERIALGDVAFERASFDDRTVRTAYAAEYPSTLILYGREREVWRHVGDITDNELAAVLDTLACRDHDSDLSPNTAPGA